MSGQIWSKKNQMNYNFGTEEYFTRILKELLQAIPPKLEINSSSFRLNSCLISHERSNSQRLINPIQACIVLFFEQHCVLYITPPVHQLEQRQKQKQTRRKRSP